MASREPSHDDDRALHDEETLVLSLLPVSPSADASSNDGPGDLFNHVSSFFFFTLAVFSRLYTVVHNLSTVRE